ncbi:uncharacterized protein A1O9_08781 [Exophiala aquamarina CBS 119918]|uniref:Uncharacterized protein n=1 Tax=Exophiala aquamarina CBS 119918 TaxID=1182545 RepID=A0A072P774_9EURO|nr:uncharacterized protein A1O9_08781 [Exophiala aquamarina CBS 119918]KEF55128.1 hypothetical protein A1O9_08781 [Exophiala aquamarina CBS 119918]
MDNNPPEEGPFGPISEWDDFGAPATTDDLGANTAFQPNINNIYMGRPQDHPTYPAYPSRVHVSNDGSPVRGGQRQAGIPSQGHTFGEQAQSNTYPLSNYTYQQQLGGVSNQAFSGGHLGRDESPFDAPNSYGSNMLSSDQQMFHQWGQRQLVPVGIGSGYTQYPTVQSSIVAPTGNYSFGQQPYSNTLGAMRPPSGNMNFNNQTLGTATESLILPQSGVGEPNQAQQIMDMLNRPARLGARRPSPPGSGTRTSTPLRANTANTTEAPLGATRRSSQNIPDLTVPSRQTPSRPARSCATPTAEDVRNNVKLTAPRSNAYERFPANHPVSAEVVKMRTGWHSGLNHFAKYGDDEEPRLKYAMKLGRGRRPGGGKKGPDGKPEDAYSYDHPVPAAILPARLGLMSFMRHWPNHAWGQGIRLLMAEGVEPHQLWHNLPVVARHSKYAPRPWNYVQHVYSRETARMAFEQTGVKRVPKARGTKRNKSSDGVEPQGSGKKLKPNPERTTPPPSTEPRVDPSSPLTPLRETRDIQPRKRYLYVAPDSLTLEDYRYKLGHKKAVFLETVRRTMSVTDEVFARADPEFQVTHLENVMDAYTTRHARHLRIRNNLPKADALWKDDDQADCMMRALKQDRGYAQMVGESNEAYIYRLRIVVMKNLLTWMDNRIEEKQEELKKLFPAENDMEAEDEGADIYGEEDQEADWDAEMDPAGEEEQEEQPAQTEQAAGDDQAIE